MAGTVDFRKSGPIAAAAKGASQQSLREEGAAIVEFAVAASVYFAVFFGLIETCLALYTFNFVSDAAREATRYAVVRGSDSCLANSSFPNCNLLPTNVTSTTDPTQNPVLAYIETMNYPGLSASNLSTTVKWWVATQSTDSNGNPTTTWPTQCTGSTDSNGNACNAPGNEIQVTVTYTFPYSIPFWHKTVLSLSSTSQMVINL